jgi:CRISPR-associated endonuclease/helicase Cas3
MEYIARRNKLGQEQLLQEHLLAVSNLARQLLEPWKVPPAELGQLAGLLHDLGKYSQEFQAKIQDQDELRIHHSHPGAEIAAAIKQRELQLAILAHHGGLRDASSASYHREESILPDPTECLRAMQSDTEGIKIPPLPQRLNLKNLPSMLATRILLGALVCADWEDSMRFDGEEYPRPPEADWEHIHSLLHQHRSNLEPSTDDEVNQARQRVWDYAGALAQQNLGIYTLSAPTGTGKTLAMLRFALEHSIKHNLRRIIIATPFLSITDQWEELINKLIDKYLECSDDKKTSHFVLVDHSMVDHSDDEDSLDYRARNYYKAWFHPVIVTTFNQLLESLFERRCSSLRKLPQLARSVIMLDEFHTIPTELMEYTLRALRYVSEWGHSTVLLASATPPEPGVITNDYQILSQDEPLDSSILNAPPVTTLRPRRTFHTVNDLEPISIIDLSALVLEEHKNKPVCVVLNFTEDAATLASFLYVQGIDVLHLSTRMCPKHREERLEQIRHKLQNGERFVLVATQCIEAGIDLDFPVLFRALAPLTSIVQAAGRCNRHGKLPTGNVYLFTLDSDGSELERLKHLSSFYRQGALSVYNNLIDGHIDIQQLESIDTLMEYQRLVRRSPDRGVLTGIGDYDFEGVSNGYQLIQRKPTTSIIIPRYAGGIQAVDIKPKQVHEFRKSMVDVFIKDGSNLLSYCEPVPRVDKVYVLLEDSLYDDLIGLDPKAAAFLVV